jgi:NAD-dependent deacetylase
MSCSTEKCRYGSMMGLGHPCRKDCAHPKEENMKKKIVVFSGAGLDKESGVLTFRDCQNGLWGKYKIEDVATPSAWKKNREKVLDFYNERRREMPTVEPNLAHKELFKLEEKYDVTHVTQNVSDLLERGGSTNVIHLHGELTKARGCYNNPNNRWDNQYITYDIGYDDINIGDKCAETDSQLRPHIVWFEEYPLRVDEAADAIRQADVLIVIGTSLQIGYTLSLLGSTNAKKVYYVDPEPMKYLDNLGLEVEYINKVATEGIVEVIEKLK